MNIAKLNEKIEKGDGLTLSEVKYYCRNVKPKKETYGKYESLAKVYLEEHCFGTMLALVGELPDYLHGVDKAAEEMYETMYDRLSRTEKYQKTGDYLSDLRKDTEIRRLIEEEILREIVYVNE